MRRQNIVLFSSGVSESNGMLESITRALGEKDYRCVNWHELFRSARDTSHIALLRMLIKKIPSFDYAVLICEGHDRLEMNRRGQRLTLPVMRDNVLFEIGLCTMALGLNRTILLTDGIARLPEDLVGQDGAAALKHIVYDPKDMASWSQAAEQAREYILTQTSIHRAAADIDRYIHETSHALIPTVVGASVSTACGYMTNFVLRALEAIRDGYIVSNSADDALQRVPDDKVYMHIILPESFTAETAMQAQIRLAHLQNAFAPTARYRYLEFKFRREGDELHIYDYPTTLVTSYQTAQLILRMDADDDAACDPEAAVRFNDKELDLFESALRAMMSERFIRSTIAELYRDDSPASQRYLSDRLIAMLPRVTVERRAY